MKVTALLQLRHRRRTAPAVSLFAFLAVLICTMGALVPLLLAMTRTARHQAEAAAVAKAAELAAQYNAEVQSQQKYAKWSIKELTKSREQTQSQLAEARFQLGHVEDHARRIRGDIQRFERAFADLDNVENADRQRLGRSEADLRQIRGQIADAERRLGEAGKTAGRQRSFAVVPYEGPNQTHRRPIYLECRADCVVLQPEGIMLTEADFEGPMGPSNPLASALRAAREHLLAQHEFNPNIGEPYPMLLVRPEGIGAYYAARAALKSWDCEFGYELIGDDWKLAYPSPDPRLAEVVQQTVATARRRQAQLIAAAPRQYDVRPRGAYRASPDGGFVPAGNTTDAGNDRGYRPAASAGYVGGNNGTGYANGGAAGNGYGGVPGSGQGTGTSNGGNGQATGVAGIGNGTGGYNNGQATGGYGNGQTTGNYFNGQAVGGYNNGQATGVPDSYAGGNGIAGTPGTQVAFAPGSGGNGYNPYVTTPETMGNGGSGMSGSAASGGTSSNRGGVNTASPANPYNTPTVAGGTASGRSERPDGYVVGQPAREMPTPPTSQPASPSSPRGYALRPGEWEPTPEAPPKMSDDPNDKKHNRPKSLADNRGEDWGLRNASRGSVGVTRPIRIECYADRLVVVSDRDPANTKVVPLGPSTASSIDTFVSAVWVQIEAWGIAGRGMYWKPVLQVAVAPGADERFADLAVLLDGSGMTVVRK